MEKSSTRPPATPEEIWEILRSITEKQEQAAAEADRRREEFERRLQESKLKTRRLDQLVQESKLETEREFRETDRRLKETERYLKESAKQLEKTERSVAETARQLRKTDARFNSQWGKLMESLVEGDLVRLLRERNVKVERTLMNARGRRNGHHYEYDILAVNGEEVVVVEVKTTLRPEDVKHFVQKLHAYTEWAPEHRARRILGAVAYLKADASVVRQAVRQGLFVIRATGSSASIVNDKEFQPKVFR